jgi:epoxyqueuosine reductase
MDKRKIITIIKELSNEFGFIDAGVIEPQRPTHFDKYINWLAEGHALGMGYMDTERARSCREDPLLLFPECKSIIVLLSRYPSPNITGDRSENSVQDLIAAYAWGQDYHKLLIDRLDLLVERFEDATGYTWKSMAVTDSAPLLEREMAFSAGLGWIGKNSCLISPRFGSFTFIAELFVDFLLEPEDKRVSDHCGTCHRCVDACPTHCILPNRTIQAERCISYLTIENRGAIVSELRSYIGSWIFGCDICQMVCPWNRKADNQVVDPHFTLYKHLENLDLISELKLSEEDFKHVFKRSPLLRTRRSGYLRNIALVLGNQRNFKAIDQLFQTAKEVPDPIVRGAAIWALSRIGGEEVKVGLMAALAEESNGSVRDEIQQALNKLA